MKLFWSGLFQRLVWWSYQFLSYFYLVFVWVYLIIRATRQPAYLRFWRERIGFIKPQVPAQNTVQKLNAFVIWIHAVSVGESRSVKPLIQMLIEGNPNLHVVLTHHTPTARETTSSWVEEWKGRLHVHYAPYDAWGAYGIFVSRLQALGELKACLLIENQVWPNLTAYLQKRNIPVLVINGRCSDRSFCKIQRSIYLKALAAITFKKLYWVGAQSKTDAQRFLDLGANRVQVMRNLKFDVSLNLTQVQQGNELRAQLKNISFVLMLASSREGEELPFLNAYRQWLTTMNVLSNKDEKESHVIPTKNHLIIVVPRHPQRFSEVANQIEGAGFKCLRSSQLNLEQQPQNLLNFLEQKESDELCVLLGDDLGRMSFWYALADWILMGGTWGHFGGQNLIEPLQQGKLVWLGSHTENFDDISERALNTGVAQRVILEGGIKSSAALEPAFKQALSQIEKFVILKEQNPKKTRALQMQAIDFAEQQKGGTIRLFRVLQQLLKI